MLATAAYNLRATKKARILVTRGFPDGGDAAVAVGDAVTPRTLIGHGSTEQALCIVRLETDNKQVQAMIMKNVGDHVHKGEMLAYHTYFFGLGYREYVSPVDGTIIGLDEEWGWLTIREDPRPYYAFVPGVVQDVLDGHGVVIETAGGFVSGSAAVGGAAWGEALVLPWRGDDPMVVADLPPSLVGKVVIAPTWVDERGLEAVFSRGARGLVTGGMDARVFRNLARTLAELTWDEYRARYYHPEFETGDEYHYAAGDEVGLTVVLTEGFGHLSMREEARGVLVPVDGAPVYLSGSPQGGAAHGECPFVVACTASPSEVSSAATPVTPATPASLAGTATVISTAKCAHAKLPAGFAWNPGQRLRVVAGPDFGQTGVFLGWRAAVTLPTGRTVNGAAVRLDDGRKLDVPAWDIEPLIG